MTTNIKHICLIDDDVDDHLLFSIVLKEIANAVTLTYFSKCAEVLEYLSTSTTLPDLILLDVNILGNENYSCLIKLKSGERTRSIPVIVWSNSATHKVKEEALNFGAYQYIIKPTSVNSLKDTISEILLL